jgi:hypothetical protein
MTYIYMSKRERLARTIPLQQHLADLLDIHAPMQLNLAPVAEKGIDIKAKISCAEATELTLEILVASGIRPPRPN